MKHGLTLDENGNQTRIYGVWAGMKSRCFNKNASNYKYYGAKGIDVCNEWSTNFKKFYDWATANGYADNLSIERIDVTKGYCPDNCTWIPISKQESNKTNTKLVEYEGVILTQSEMARKYNISRCLLNKRLILGWTIENAINIPARERKIVNKQLKVA